MSLLNTHTDTNSYKFQRAHILFCLAVFCRSTWRLGQLREVFTIPLSFISSEWHTTFGYQDRLQRLFSYFQGRANGKASLEKKTHPLRSVQTKCPV